MPKPEAILKPLIYEIDPARLEGDVPVLSYAMPAAAFRKLKEIQGAQINPSLEGLDVILGWAAPEVDLLTLDRPDNATERTIVLKVLDPQQPLDAIKGRVRMGLNAWLSVALGEKALEVATLLDDGRARGSWRESAIKTALNPAATMPEPVDPALFDLLALRAARLLCKGSQQSSGRQFLASGASKQMFGGKELVSYPPLPAGKGYWSETMRVFAMTTPEQPGIRIGVHLGIRNFVRLVRTPGYNDPRRTVDVFIPSVAGASDSSLQRWIPARIALKKEVSPTGAQQITFRNGKALDALQMIATAAGAPGLFDRFDGTPACEAGVWVLPRGGTVHGDKYLPGGSGVSMPDRATMFSKATEYLGHGGFSAVESLKIHRLRTRKWNWGRPFLHLRLNSANELHTTHHQQIRQAIKEAIKYGSKEEQLTIATFWQRPETPERMRRTLESVLGSADAPAKDQLSWNGELTIRFASFPAEILGRSIDLTVDVPETLSKQQKAKVAEAAREVRLRESEQEMLKYIGGSLRGTKGPVIAILELPESVQGTDGDPYITAQRAFAAQGAPVQVLLWSATGAGPDGNITDDEKAEQAKFRACFLDLLRTLGASPRTAAIREPSANEGLESLQGWWLIRKNASQPQKNDSFTTPICVEAHGTSIRVAMLAPGGQHKWVSYSEAVCQLTLRQAENLAGKPPGDTYSAVERFFERCIADDVPRTVFCEAVNLRSAVRGLRNGSLRFGELALGAVGLTSASTVIRDSESTSIVRISLDGDRTPSYVVEERAQGITAGIFSEASATRTFWVSRGLPTALQKDLSVHRANATSRREPQDGQPLAASSKRVADGRRFPSLSEVCAVTTRRDVTPEELAQLSRKCMKTHIASQDELLLPFPLHEAALLSDHVR